MSSFTYFISQTNTAIIKTSNSNGFLWPLYDLDSHDIIISLIYCDAKTCASNPEKKNPLGEKIELKKSSWNFLSRFSDCENFSYFHNRKFYFHQQSY